MNGRASSKPDTHTKQQHEKFDKVIKSNGFLINDYDKCVYLKVFNDACVILIYMLMIFLFLEQI